MSNEEKTSIGRSPHVGEPFLPSPKRPAPGNLPGLSAKHAPPSRPFDALELYHHAGLTGRECHRMRALAIQLGVPVHRVLLAEGWVTPVDYAATLAHYFAIAAVAVPTAAAPDDVLIDATGQCFADVQHAVRSAQSQHRKPVLFPGAHTRDVAPDEPLAETYAESAVRHILSGTPHLSAGRRMWLWQYFAAALGAGAALGLAIADPGQASRLALITSAALFSFVVLFRLLILAAAAVPEQAAHATSRNPHRAASTQPLSDYELPTYSVLVPLFREAEILPDLIDALTGLDYPLAKLDIALILEASDHATRAAIQHLRRPAHIRVIVVPDGQPRTKPKALNVALQLTRGEIVTVFDAEDMPAPGQLRLAAAVFAANPGRYACLQARLAIYNPRQSWLTRHFALEYAALFHVFLPALVLLRLPLPLSGTSNHFPRAILEQSAWDPFNVTEDADLGLRLARQVERPFGDLRGEIGLIDSETYEEAPHTFRQWLPQRTRWIKGWMQTYLVHTRQPFRLLRGLGLWRTLGFHALIGGFILSALAYPVFLFAAVIEFTGPRPFATEPGSLHHAALTIALVALTAGIAAALLQLFIGAARGRLKELRWHVLAAPLYWLLISIAAYRALIQIVWRPHVWEKTPHTARTAHRR